MVGALCAGSDKKRHQQYERVQFFLFSIADCALVLAPFLGCTLSVGPNPLIGALTSDSEEPTLQVFGSAGFGKYRDGRSGSSRTLVCTPRAQN